MIVDRKRPALPVTKVSDEGGLFPRWRDDDSLEFGSGSRYLVHHRSSGKTDSTWPFRAGFWAEAQMAARKRSIVDLIMPGIIAANFRPGKPEAFSDFCE